MFEPRRAPVKPRGVCPASGATLPLEDEIRELLDAGKTGCVQIVGGPGMGKTTTLHHLAAVLPANANIALLDEPNIVQVAQFANSHLVAYTATAGGSDQPTVQYRLASWGNDEFIEYLLAVHTDRCASVMARIREVDRPVLWGVPELCRMAIDLLASDPAVPDARSAVRQHLSKQLTDPAAMRHVRLACLEALVTYDPSSTQPAMDWTQMDLPADVSGIVRHAPVQVLLGAEQIADDLRERAMCEYLSRRIPRALIEASAELVSDDRPALDSLRAMLRGAPSHHPMAASLLHAADPAWTPEPGQVPVLDGAYLENAAWPGVKLAETKLLRASFSGADLTKAILNHSWAAQVDFTDARLAGASLVGIQAQGAQAARADLTGVNAERAKFDSANLEGAKLDDAAFRHVSFSSADLTGASLRRADLSHVVFVQAKIANADFTEANLTGARLARLRLSVANFADARFRAAELDECDLENMKLPDAEFENAILIGALLTGSIMPRANFTSASLKNAGLADIEWEGACLRNADLRGANFHLGSTRSGLLATPIASEGTRTGFYTDDFDEQSFKAPEEIRKANLRRADLRGAKLDGTDFYLVDLRGALFDSDQEPHFRRCKAIL